MSFLLRRLAFYAVAIWAAVTVNFAIPRVMPGNAVDTMLTKFPQLTPQSLKALEAEFGTGTHSGLLSQYFSYWNQVLHFNLGVSVSEYPTKVSTIIGQTLPWTLILVGTATVISFAIGTLLGIAAADHRVWFPPTNTNSLEPNLDKWPTNQLPVRKAISLAIDRNAISEQGEGGLEPPAQNASGLTLPIFQSFLSSSVSGDKLDPAANPAAAAKVLQQAGYTKDSSGYYALHGQEVKLDITDPASYSDYAADDAIVANDLKKAGINATFVGQSVDAWSSDIADGNYQLSMHWSQTSVSPYQLYNSWLNSALATPTNRAGNYEGLKDPTIDAQLKKLASAPTASEQAADVAPIEQYVATQLPIIPTVYGVVFDEYNTGKFTGWPDASNEYESGSPNAPTNEVVVLHLKPAS